MLAIPNRASTPNKWINLHLSKLNPLNLSTDKKVARMIQSLIELKSADNEIEGYLLAFKRLNVLSHSLIYLLKLSRHDFLTALAAVGCLEERQKMLGSVILRIDSRWPQLFCHYYFDKARATTNKRSIFQAFLKGLGPGERTLFFTHVVHQLCINEIKEIALLIEDKKSAEQFVDLLCRLRLDAATRTSQHYLLLINSLSAEQGSSQLVLDALMSRAIKDGIFQQANTSFRSLSPLYSAYVYHHLNEKEKKTFRNAYFFSQEALKNTMTQVIIREHLPMKQLEQVACLLSFYCEKKIGMDTVVQELNTIFPDEFAYDSIQGLHEKKTSAHCHIL